ncbi:hypothetical protein BVG84_09980 [Serratia marcescens]|nr:hypothetical protein BVG84_09980 [Serratia marcescens]
MPANERKLYPNIKRIVWSDWAEGKVRQQRWHPMRVAMLFRLGPIIPTPSIAKMFGVSPRVVRSKAESLGIRLYRCFRNYADWEIKFMKDNRQKLTQKEIARHLGRTEASVSTAMLRRGINPGKPRGEHHQFAKHSDDDVELCRALADEGLFVSEIARKMELDHSTVWRWVNFESRSNIELEDYGRARA